MRVNIYIYTPEQEREKLGVLRPVNQCGYNQGERERGRERDRETEAETETKRERQRGGGRLREGGTET